MDKHYWINRLKLQHHPEGGFFKEVYKSDTHVQINHQSRSIATSIYYLLDSETKSFCHRLKSDELWYYHQGTGITVYMIDESGRWSIQICGPNEGENLSILIPKSVWFGARVMDPNSFSLVSCVVSPGFEFADFEMIDTNELIELFPMHKDEIFKYTLK